MTPELRELVDLLQTKGNNVKVDELQGLRKKVSFADLTLHHMSGMMTRRACWMVEWTCRSRLPTIPFDTCYAVL